MTPRFPEPVAFFPGSFNPFTIGHADIVERALKIAARVVVGVGYNMRKEVSAESAARRALEIATLYEGNPRVEVVSFGDLATQAATRCGATFIIKGVRSVADYEYELQMADINRRISGMETLLLLAAPGLASVSSSMVRELQAFGLDVTEFLPTK